MNINTPVVSDSHTLAVLSLSTPSGHSEVVTIRTDKASLVAAAIIRFANSHGISASMVNAHVLGEPRYDRPHLYAKRLNVA
jgi:hypothetical protein